MKFLIVVQDLRISGTSEGIVSRSFISYLKKAYPNAKIDLEYFKNYESDDLLQLLPVDSINEYIINRKINPIIIWINWIYWRVFKISLVEKSLVNKYRKYIKKIKFEKYDYVFIRSSGQGYETVLACHDLPILKKAIVNFHDPYPVFWDTGSDKVLSKLEFYKLRQMWKIVQEARICISPAKLLSEDMEHLYGSNKKIFTLPHQFDQEVFEVGKSQVARKRKKKLVISYHGVVQLGRDLDILLDAYSQLIEEHSSYLKDTEFILRIKGKHSKRLKLKYAECKNIVFLETIFFNESSYEQKMESDIHVILENCSPHSNILVGKAPFLASLEKAVLILSPARSELRSIIDDDKYIANCQNIEEIKSKLKVLIDQGLSNREATHLPFRDYFSEENFIKRLYKILDNY